MSISTTLSRCMEPCSTAPLKVRRLQRFPAPVRVPSRVSRRKWICRAEEGEDVVKEEEQERDLVAGYDVDEETLLDSPLFGNVLKIGAVGAVLGIIVVMYFLAKPVIDNTIRAFPGAT